MVGQELELWVTGPVKSKERFGDLGYNCNCVIISRADGEEDVIYREIWNWLVSNNIECTILPEIYAGEVVRLMLLFRAFHVEPKTIERINSGYLQFRREWKSARFSEWQDAAFERCQEGLP